MQLFKKLKTYMGLCMSLVLLASSLFSMNMGHARAQSSDVALNQAVPSGTQEMAVTENVYLQARDASAKATLKVLNEVEQLKQKRKQLPSPDAVMELPDRRTANSKHYLMKDGSYQAVISVGDEHFEDENHRLQDIVPFLIDESDMDLFTGQVSKESAGEIKQLRTSSLLQRQSNKVARKNTFYRAPQVPFDVRIPQAWTDGYRVGKNQQSLTFIPQQASAVTGSVYGIDGMYYENAWNGTDVSLQVKENGVKETLILKNAAAPLDYSFEVLGELDNQLQSGQWTIQSAWLMDANGTRRDVSQTLVHEEGRTFLKLSADTTGLVYPVVVDPTVTIISSSQETFISSTSDSASRFTDSLYLGDYTSETHYNIYIQFALSAIPSGSKISSASLNMYYYYPYQYHDYLGNPVISVYPILSPWNINTYPFKRPPNGNGLNTTLNSTGNSNVWQSFDVTPHVKSFIENGVPNYGWVLSASPYNYFIYWSSYYQNESYRPKLIISYNAPASTPTVLSPNGGEFIGNSQTITWSPATDSDTPQANLVYNLQVSYDGGATWKDIVGFTTPGATSYPYGFADVPQSSSTLVRVRAYDGSVYSPFDQSNAVFTNNRVPNVPASPAPGSASSASPGIINSLTPTLTWSFSDPDAGNTQSAYKVLLYQSSGLLVSDSGWLAGSTTAYAVPAGQISRGSTYYWTVQVKDNKGAVSPASAPRYIRPNNLPLLTIQSYTNGQTVPDNVLTFTWSFVDPDGQNQIQYQIIGSKDHWATRAFDSGVQNGNALSYTTPPLSNGQWDFAVRAFDGMEWSAWMYRDNLTLPSVFEPNDGPSTAIPVLYGSLSTIISSASDVDYFKYTASNSGVDRIQLTPAPGKNYDVYVYDSSQNLIAAGVRASGVPESILYEVTAGSAYFIQVVGVNGDYSASSPYTLTVSQALFQTETKYEYDDNGRLTKKTVTRVN